MEKNLLTSTTHNIAWLSKRYQDEELQLKPPFQRNPVWTERQKSYLIDTILHGYPIPELYIQEYTDANGNDVYVVVDGQQRVRACLEFIRGEFSMSPKDSPDWADMVFDDLSEEERKRIYNYNFVVRVLPDIPDVELRAIFSRLNRHVVALNKQELRHATYWGEFIESIEKISDSEGWSEVGLFTPNDVRRMLDIEYVSELAVGFLHGLQNKKESLDKWYEAYENEFPDRRRMEKVFSSTLLEIIKVLPNINKTRWRKKSDFYTLFLLLAESASDFPLASDVRIQLGEALTKFGTDVDAYLRDPDGNAGLPKSIKDYSAAVERAASDLARRRVRRTELMKAIEQII
ncbi:conserved hypothetical protein [Mesorhizobium plurifarium]|uniref:GmrSD restriction endonucleases N-terminal domain-containing protein n=1 Tax=Mesorhizobium plurifarium TaxID=69974 RepID=A0A090G8A1_MESPL|nr:conserved hypothetical protein [Mesorhizobium plurifarium]